MLRNWWTHSALRVSLLAVLVLVVAACGVGQQGPSQGEGGGGGPNKICMMPKLVGIPYFNASEQGAKEALK
jgi:ABC-type sugar transport system substrate-binding protein